MAAGLFAVRSWAACGAPLVVFSVTAGCAVLDRWELAPPAEPPPPPARPFDMHAGAIAMAATAAEVDEDCQGEQPAHGAVRIIFERTGAPSSVKFSAGSPYEGTSTGACVVQHFRNVRVPPFDGEQVTITKDFATSGVDQ